MLFNKYIGKYYKKYWYWFVIGILTCVFIDMVQLLIPNYLGQVVNKIEDAIGTPAIANEILWIVGKVLIIAAIIFIGRATWRLTIFRASSNISRDLRHEMFWKAERLSQTFYHDNKVGTVLNWFTSDVQAIEEFIGWGSIMAVDAFFMSIMTFTVMCIKNWFLALFTIIPIGLIVTAGIFLSRFMSNKWRNKQKQNDILYDFTQENFTGIRVIKAFVKEYQQLHAFAKVAKKSKDTNIDYVKLSVKLDVLIAITLSLVTSMILGLGSFLAYKVSIGQPIVIGNLTININAGELVEFFGLFEIIIWPMMALGRLFSMLSSSRTSLKRITAFLDQEEDVKTPENAVILTEPKGGIKFNDLTFNYPGGLMPSLKHITCEILPGETVGIVGKIGSGKTTLVNSLLRLYNLDKGSIYIDGIDIMDIDIESLRDTIGYAPQDNFLFSDKINNNIAFGEEEANKEDIIAAAKFADVHDNITSFKDGYETLSGERGVTLSGGQKQRISIARAFIKNAPIMIMDDSVSAVDVKTEETILKNVKEKRDGKTTIIIASRISTVKDLNKIIVLNDGCLEAVGNHEELLKTSKTYKKLSYLQQLEAEVNGEHK